MIVAVPKTNLTDYKKIEYVPKQSENGDIEQPKYVANFMQQDTGFSGSPVL